MKEYLYIQKVKFRSRPSFIALKVLAALAIIFSGPLVVAIPVSISFFSFITLSHAQVQYLVPRTKEEMKKQCYWNVIMICSEIAVCMLLWIIPSLLIYERLGNMIRRYPLFTALCIIVVVLELFKWGFETERSRWTRQNEKEMSLLSALKEDWFDTVTGILLYAEFVVFIGSDFGFGLFEESWDYQNGICISVIILTIVLIIVGIFKETGRWKIADYLE